MTDEKHPYEVGYKKPPKHGQFKKGQPSANPRGRKKKSRSFSLLLNKFLQETVTIVKNGAKKKVTAQEAIALAMIANAAKGNDKAIDRIFKIFPEQRPEEWRKKAEKDLEDLFEKYTLEELKNILDGLAKGSPRESNAEPQVTNAKDANKTNKGK